jgi:hypothetical protein
MSAEELFTDLLHFNLSHALSRFMDWYKGWPAPLKAFIAKLTDDEAQILWNVAQIALGDALAGKTIIEIAEDIWPTIEAQVPGKAKSDLLDVLGILLRASK